MGPARRDPNGDVRCGPGAGASLSGAHALLMGVRIDLNRADAETFELIPGIGPALSRRIIADRHARGSFAAVEDLVRVQGIGPKRLAATVPYVTVRPVE